MTADDAATICAWHYPPPYDFYDLSADVDDQAELSEPHRWGREYFAACNESGELAGFFQFRTPDSGVVEIGLGMHPDLTGRGLGRDYMSGGMDFARERWTCERFRLFVAAFNRRAITVYERLGFRTVEELQRFTGGALHDFVRMESAAPDELSADPAAQRR
jgi:ribosomal-protein-alanine N-acetyltransferase